MLASLRIEIPGKTWVKFCLPALRFLMGYRYTESKNGSFFAIRMKIHPNFSSPPCGKKDNQGPEATVLVVCGK